MSRAILITGATGNIGGALIRALVKHNQYDIIAVTRNTQSATAKRLQELSPRVKLISGDLDRLDELFATAKSTAAPSELWGVYSVQSAVNNPNEKKQALSMVDAAVANGVKHFIYSSVDRGGAKSDTTPTDIPHFMIKHAVEKHLIAEAARSGMAYTILRPVAFYENLTPDFYGKIFSTSFKIYMPRGKKLQLVATSDIGTLGAQAFLSPEEYHNKAITIAGSELSFAEFKEIFVKTLKKPFPTTFSLPVRLMNMMVKDLGYMFRWFAEEGYGGNIQECEKMKGDKMISYQDWLLHGSKFT